MVSGGSVLCGEIDWAVDMEAAATPFVATEVALCHLGRFCTCCRVLTAWTLTAPRR